MQSQMFEDAQCRLGVTSYSKGRKLKKKLSRTEAKIEPNRRVLIVTEGEITEVDYFEDLKNHLGLVNVDLDICGRECDSSPHPLFSLL